MESTRRAAMAGSVFLVALATGFVMQNGDAVASRFISEPDTMVTRGPAPLARTPLASVRSNVEIPAEPVLVALATPAIARSPQADVGLSEVTLEPDEGLSAFGIPCSVALTASPAAAAMVQLSLQATCHGGEPVTVRHGDLMFTEITGTDGHLDLPVPALSATADFEVSFLDGTRIAAAADVPEAAGYERVALQWQGSTGLGLHAFEFGAGYGEPGHVFAGAAHTPERALTRGLGFLTRLGRDTVPGGWVSEIYTFPTARANRPGEVRISVEAEITSGTCGRTLSARTLRPASGRGQETAELTLAVPECDAVGEFLVLDNMLPSVTIAAK